VCQPRWWQIVNLSWLALPLALLIAPMVGAGMLWWGYTGISSAEYFRVLLLFGVAAVRASDRACVLALMLCLCLRRSLSLCLPASLCLFVSLCEARPA
jgi:hypothetical protein